MAKKTSRQSIEKRLNRAFNSMNSGDMEDTLYHIAPVFDVIAKERYPEIKSVGERIKSYILDEQDLIYYLSMQGLYKIPKGVQIAIVDDENISQPPPNVQHIKSHAGQLSDYIYHNIRCAQSHDAEIDYDVIDLGRNFGIGRERFVNDGGELSAGKFIVSNSTIIAMILVLIASPELKRIRLSGHFNMFGKISIDKQKLAGNRVYLEKKLDALFEKESVVGSSNQT